LWVTHLKQYFITAHWLCCFCNISFAKKTPPWRWPQNVTETCRRFTTIIMEKKLVHFHAHLLVLFS